MIRPKLSLRRPLAVLGAGVVGLAAALAVAAPASAHHSEVVGKAECDTTTGEFVVEWTVKSIAPANVKQFRLTDVIAKKWVGTQQTRVQVPGIEVTDDYKYDAQGSISGTHRVPGDSTKASLQVKAEWENGEHDVQWKRDDVPLSGLCVITTPPTTPPATPPVTPEPSTPPTTPPATPPVTPPVTPPTQPKAPKPTADVETDCDGAAIVTLANGDDATAAAVFVVTDGAGTAGEPITLEPGKDKVVEIPAEKATRVKVTVEGQTEPLFDEELTADASCIEATYEATCEDLTFTINNPAEGETVNAIFTPNSGDKKTLTVEPGKSGTVTFAGSEGLVVTGDIEGYEAGEPIAWNDEKPENCGGGGGGLPVTGAAAGGIAAGALVLLGIGVALFVVARRRRLTFTA
ncbi:hypothetical protein BDK92_5081 [Micromonospora pisi]|uniref:LPXTG-motif cell wall-anchored protein n=1 Tax=Micromonospora pisi TaxID=589240 RepID=A0A495JNQ9_9ACTN|nr:cell wall anchor protein [Micromonospora pisi]RKR90700.1 hypothetical protein BDK92_5081 [Micromonospora pisi]